MYVCIITRVGVCVSACVFMCVSACQFTVVNSLIKHASAFAVSMACNIPCVLECMCLGVGEMVGG